jgi:hypothetical protein
MLLASHAHSKLLCQLAFPYFALIASSRLRSIQAQLSTEHGSLHTEVPVPKSANPGSYSIELLMQDPEDQGSNGRDGDDGNVPEPGRTIEMVESASSSKREGVVEMVPKSSISGNRGGSALKSVNSMTILQPPRNKNPR